MPVISLDFVGLQDGKVFFPSPEAALAAQKAVADNILEVLSSNFPNQLGFISHPNAEGVDQYEIAKQAVHDAFPNYIVVAADQAAYPTYIHGTEIDQVDGITVLADIRIVELALDETIQDKMVASVTDSVTTALQPYYPGLDINVNTTMITGNVEISLPNGNGGSVGGVISAGKRDSSDVSFHEVLFDKILEETDVAGLGGKPLDLYLVDELDNIDGLRGGAGNDTLKGQQGDDLLKGGAGNDRVFGDSGNDTVVGSSGKDVLTGGTGADCFVFAEIEGASTSKADTITDFKSGIDEIDVSAIDANPNIAGDQAFIFVGTKAFSANATGQIRFDASTHTLQISTDADTSPEMFIKLTGVNKIVAADLVL